MARRVKPKIKYNKKNKTPKAVVGAATAALGLGKSIFGAVQARRARKAERDFDKSRLERGVSSASQKMADQPIDQSYINQLQQQQAADRASAMGALAKDPRNVLAGVQSLETQAAKQRTDLLGMQQDAKTRAMENLAREQQMAETQRLGVAEAELKGIVDQKAAAQQNIFGGIEDIASGIGAMNFGDDSNNANDNFSNPTGRDINKQKRNQRTTPGSGELPSGEKGGKIDKDGGVTPGEFDHDSNPIDMVQDGEKIGEATGGELILPPDDVQEIRMALNDGDKNAAFKLMKDLVAKYDSNVIGDDDDSEAQEGAKMQDPTVPPLKEGRAQEIVKVMKENSDQVRNVGELPFDEDPTNPAGLIKYIGDKLSFDIDSTSKAEIEFIKNYREFLVKEKGRSDAPQTKMMNGGYLEKLKAKLGAYIKPK
tara:strand:- start:11260 stop:12534 length:1275 start_codon:yes stop_codon:yes gene_type:complete